MLKGSIRGSAIIIIATAILLSLAFNAMAPSFRCGLRAFAPSNQCLQKSYFFSCTNIRQRIEHAKFYNVKVEPTDVEGWKMYTAADPEKNAYIFLTVCKDRSQMIFYPRVSQPQSMVTVYSQDGQHKRKLFHIGSQGQGWTEVGMQYALDLSCIGPGDLDKDADIPLVVVLQGKWAQLWFKDDGVFF